jgi:hypothetical protein
MLVIPEGVPRFKHVTTKMMETLGTLNRKYMVYMGNYGYEGSATVITKYVASNEQG